MEKVRPKVAIPPPFQGSIGNIGVNSFLDQFHVITVKQGMRNPSNSKVIKLKQKNCFFRSYKKLGKWKKVGLQRQLQQSATLF